MAENCGVYLSLVNDKVASIFVDLNLWKVSPNPRLPFVGAVFIEMNNPRDDGLSSNEEAPILNQIEDHVVKSIAPLNVAFPGRLTSDNIRSLYFYLPAEEGFGDGVTAAMARFPSYRFDLLIEADPDWTQYLDVLYPNPSQMTSIHNRQVLSALKDAGNIHSHVRDVDHFAYFKTAETRQEFATWALTEGFLVSEHNADDKDRPFGLRLTRAHSVDIQAIDEVTAQLVEQAEKLGGDYDGWGCPVTPPRFKKTEEKPKPQSKWFQRLLAGK